MKFAYIALLALPSLATASFLPSSDTVGANAVGLCCKMFSNNGAMGCYLEAECPDKSFVHVTCDRFRQDDPARMASGCAQANPAHLCCTDLNDDQASDCYPGNRCIHGNRRHHVVCNRFNRGNRTATDCYTIGPEPVDLCCRSFSNHAFNRRDGVCFRVPGQCNRWWPPAFCAGYNESANKAYDCTEIEREPVKTCCRNLVDSNYPGLLNGDHCRHGQLGRSKCPNTMTQVHCEVFYYIDNEAFNCTRVDPEPVTNLCCKRAVDGSPNSEHHGCYPVTGRCPNQMTRVNCEEYNYRTHRASNCTPPGSARLVLVTQ